MSLINDTKTNFIKEMNYRNYHLNSEQCLQMDGACDSRKMPPHTWKAPRRQMEFTGQELGP